MNPIPLSAPDGRLYTYACGVCHNVAGGSHAMGPWPADGPHENLIEWFQRDAARCCTCMDCGAGPVSSGCDDCNHKRGQHWMWSVIATCMQHGLVSREQYDAWCDDDGALDE